jgi:hypothetical protein
MLFFTFWVGSLTLQSNVFMQILSRKLDLTLKFTNLKDFCFRVPYYFRHEASLLKAEVAGVKSRKSLAFDRQTRPRRKWKGKRKSGRGQYISSDEDVDEDEDGDEVEVDDAEEEDIDDVVSVEEALGVEEGIQVENLAGVITILGDSDADEEGNLDDNGSGFYYRFHTCAIYGV